LYQQFSNLLMSQLDMNGPRLRSLSNNTWSGGIVMIRYVKVHIQIHAHAPLMLTRTLINADYAFCAWYVRNDHQ
jgi:hypothetical protein